MALPFNKDEYVSSLEQAVLEKDKAADLGAELVRSGFDKIYFVACGAPNRAMLITQYWMERVSKKLVVRRYFPAEFLTQEPPLDERTLIILGSKSGTTPETVSAAEYVRSTPATTVGITKADDLPLAKAVDHPLVFGDAVDAYGATYMILQALTAGMLKEADNWELFDKVMKSLDALPMVLAEASVENDARATEDARIYHEDRVLYHVAAGPCMSTAYVLGVCVLMESQWMHSYPLEAAEFFHGPFEIVDAKIPLLVLLGEDPSRPLVERVLRFCNKYTERLMVYDSKDIPMPGIDEEVRAIVAPMVLQATLRSFAEHLAVWHNQPLSTRRYMW